MINRRKRRYVIAVALLVCTGCSSSTPPSTKEDQRMVTIVSQSGGDWNRVAAADKDYLIKSLGNGNEQRAMLAFTARSTRNSRNGPPKMGGPPR